MVTLVLGAACLTALGVAVASLVKSADQAMPVAQFTFLPLSFISGIWYPLDDAPQWVVTIAHFFPLYHIAHAFEYCFVPGSGNGWQPDDLWAIAVWTAVGAFIAVRRFRFEPGEAAATVAGCGRLCACRRAAASRRAGTAGAPPASCTDESSVPRRSLTHDADHRSHPHRAHRRRPRGGRRARGLGGDGRAGRRGAAREPARAGRAHARAARRRP